MFPSSMYSPHTIKEYVVLLSLLKISFTDLQNGNYQLVYFCYCQKNVLYRIIQKTAEVWSGFVSLIIIQYLKNFWAD